MCRRDPDGVVIFCRRTAAKGQIGGVRELGFKDGGDDAWDNDDRDECMDCGGDEKEEEEGGGGDTEHCGACKP